MLEGIAFYKHMNLFEDEQDCSCVLEDLEEHKLLSKHVIARLRGITNKKRKNRLVLNAIIHCLFHNLCFDMFVARILF